MSYSTAIRPAAIGWRWRLIEHEYNWWGWRHIVVAHGWCFTRTGASAAAYRAQLVRE